jgi:putative membrane protein
MPRFLHLMEVGVATISFDTRTAAIPASRERRPHMTALLHELDTSVASRLDGNQLSTLRTIMSADRTLMSWVRTSLSLQSFGFTLYKVLEGFISAGREIAAQTPTNVGLILCFSGVVAMLMGITEYRHTLKLLDMHGLLRLGRLTVLMAVAISAAGVVLFIAIATDTV